MKILILGGVCSGKTTLAKNLAKKLNITYTEIDAIFSKQDHARKTEAETAHGIDIVIKQQERIADICYVDNELIMKLAQNSDKIYVLKVNFFINLCRVFLRNYQYRINKTPESLKHFLKMLGHVLIRNSIYENYYEGLTKHGIQFKIVHSMKDILDDINQA